jgi:hypothetical protein
MVNTLMGDYNQGGGLNLSSGIFTVPATGYYHVFATIAVNYQPINGPTSYSNILAANPMQLVFAFQQFICGSGWKRKQHWSKYL